MPPQRPFWIGNPGAKRPVPDHPVRARNSAAVYCVHRLSGPHVEQNADNRKRVGFVPALCCCEWTEEGERIERKLCRVSTRRPTQAKRRGRRQKKCPPATD